MPDREVDYLLIGGGLAAGNCSRWLREEGAEGSILLVGREPDPPYNRPDCSKGYLRGEKARAETFFRPDEFWGEQDIELLTRTSVTALDAQARTVKLSSKEEIGFGKALVATGANVRRLNVEGCDLDQIHYLRTLGNSDAIREGVADAERVVLIGGSYIGCEVAASLTMLGKRCTIVMQEEVTLERGFGKTAGSFFEGLLTEHGVEVHGQDELERFEGDGRVQRVLTRAGLSLEADAVVIGAGVTPDVTLAGKAGLEIGEKGGVRCSSRLESSVQGIFAAGDICEYDSPLHGGAAGADRALGCRIQPRQDGGAEHAGPRRAARGRAVLLLGSRRLGRPRVRGTGLRVGPGDRPRLDRGRDVHQLLPAGRGCQGGARGRPLG